MKETTLSTNMCWRMGYVSNHSRQTKWKLNYFQLSFLSADPDPYADTGQCVLFIEARDFVIDINEILPNFFLLMLVTCIDGTNFASLIKQVGNFQGA